MNTKTPGDILAERIEEEINSYHVSAATIRERMRVMLAEYRAPWTLPAVSVLTPEQIAAGWHCWHGGECPVWGESTPKVMLRSGSIGHSSLAQDWIWADRNSSGDIIAYLPDPYAELKKAHAEGKVIEHRTDAASNWCAIPPQPGWSLPPENYRVKPEPVMVPLSAEDVTPGSVIRSRDVGMRKPWIAVLAVISTGVEILGNSGTGFTLSFTVLFADGWGISRDGGKTWAKCEKEAK